MLIRDPEGRKADYVIQNSADWISLYPHRVAPTQAHLNYTVARCHFPLYVTRDFTRVFVGDDGPGSGVAREADTVEIEALYERFNLPELRRVLEQRQPNGEPSK
jgi:hypothetical protein